MLWPWLALVGLGVFHGANPAMGWLFAVALGLHRRSRAVVLVSIVPVAVGHALALTFVVAAVLALGMMVDPRALYLLAGLALLSWALYNQLYGSGHRVRVGMRTGMLGLGVWSFVMASAHGAGLMLVPFLLPLARVESLHGHPSMAGTSLLVALAAVGVHTLAMLGTTAGIAVVVYDWAGLAFLRRGWVNLERLWAGALATTWRDPHPARPAGALTARQPPALAVPPGSLVSCESSEHFSSVFDTNVRGVMFAMKHAAPVLIAQGSGTIITIGSVGGLRGGLAGHIYSASKAAALHLSRCVAAEVSGSGVRVNTISPGGIITGIFAKSAGLEGVKADRALDAIADLFGALQPVPRPGVTDDIARAAVFLASDAASFITGQDLVVDGGLVPFGKYGWQESLAFRAEIARRVRAQTEPLG